MGQTDLAEGVELSYFLPFNPIFLCLSLMRAVLSRFPDLTPQLLVGVRLTERAPATLFSVCIGVHRDMLGVCQGLEGNSKMEGIRIAWITPRLKRKYLSHAGHTSELLHVEMMVKKRIMQLCWICQDRV